jgi:Carbohydrate binding module (family 6)
VGTTRATAKIQPDRYSALSAKGATTDFLNPTDTFKGWKTVLSAPKAFVRYDAVDFGTKKLKKVLVQANTTTGGAIEIRIDKIDGPLLAKVKLAPGNKWDIIQARLEKYIPGTHTIYIISVQEAPIEIDWITFE